MISKNIGKQLIALLLSGVMIVALTYTVPLRGLADENQTITTANISPTSTLLTMPLEFTDVYTTTDGSGPGWSWVQGTRTLTLNGINMRVDIHNMAAISLPRNSTVVLNGINNITYVRNAIQSNGSLEIRGNGTLNANSLSPGSGGPAIANDSFGNITITGGTINAPNGGIHNYQPGNITINGGTININGTDQISALATWMGNIIINGGTITAHGGYMAISAGGSSSYGGPIPDGEILSSLGGNLEINGGVVKAEGLTFGIAAGMRDGIGGHIDISGGVIDAVGDKWGIISVGRLNIAGGTVTAISKTLDANPLFSAAYCAIYSAPFALPANYWWRISENSQFINNAVSPYIWSDAQRYVHITTVAPPPNTEVWQPPLPTNRFIDVPNDNWQNAAVSWADRNGITTGSGGSDTFKPDDPVTRAEFVTFFHRIYGSPDAQVPDNRFRDVPNAPNWQNAPVAWADRTGITTGVPAGSDIFLPNDNITREQIATMLYRYIGGGVPAPENRLGGYTDHNAISSWARDAVNWAVYNGIMGVGSNTLNPRGNATRAEAVTMLHRVVETFNISAP